MDFPQTEWTLLSEAFRRGDTGAEVSLAEFCQRYREPVMALMRRQGCAESEADELTDAFFLHLKNSPALNQASRNLGPFRRSLAMALSEFLATTRGKPRTGGGVDATQALPDRRGLTAGGRSTTDNDPALGLDREWALCLVARALESVRRRWLLVRTPEHFAVLRSFLPGAAEIIAPEVAAARLGLTEDAFQTELLRVTQSLRDAIRSQIAETVSHSDEIADEMRHLAGILRSPGRPDSIGPHGPAPDNFPDLNQP